MIKKIKNLINVILYFKNWPTYIADHFNLIKDKEIVYFLRNGLRFKTRVGTFDRGIIGEVCLDKIYIPNDEFKIKETDLVIDIGAQIGIFSVFAASLANKGKIFCFEPVFDNFSFLKTNIELNKLNNVFAYNLAVSDTDGKREIFLDNLNTGGHSIYNRSGTENIIVSESVDLNKWIEVNKFTNIDFLKIDCEGAEYEILKGLSDDKFKLIKKISMEYHNIDQNNNIDFLRSFLINKGYNCFIRGSMLYASR